MSLWKVIFATLVIFAAGFVVGGLVVRKTAIPSSAVSKPSGPNLRSPGQFGLQALQRRMDRELNLTPDQDEQIHQIIVASQERLGNLWKPVSEAMGTETQDTCDQIRAVLTPEQQAKFDEFSKKRPGGDFGDRGWHHPPGFPGGMTNHFFTNPSHQ